MAARKQRRSTEPYEECPGYVFEQLRVERSCLGYVVADKETRRAAIVDPEAEMVEPMLDFVFEQGMKTLLRHRYPHPRGPLLRGEGAEVQDGG